MCRVAGNVSGDAARRVFGQVEVEMNRWSMAHRTHQTLVVSAAEPGSIHEGVRNIPKRIPDTCAALTLESNQNLSVILSFLSPAFTAVSELSGHLLHTEFPFCSRVTQSWAIL